MHTEVICRYCRGAINDPTSARYKRGGAFHENCFEIVEANRQHSNEVFNSFDTINTLKVELDTKLLEEDGLLHNEEEFSDEAWFVAEVFKKR